MAAGLDVEARLCNPLVAAFPPLACPLRRLTFGTACPFVNLSPAISASQDSMPGCQVAAQSNTGTSHSANPPDLPPTGASRDTSRSAVADVLAEPAAASIIQRFACIPQVPSVDVDYGCVWADAA